MTFVAPLGIRVPDFCIIPHPEVERLAQAQKREASDQGLRQELLIKTQSLSSDEIFARAQPLDESLAPHLSFAGVYHSYAPRRKTARADNLTQGFNRVMAGRRSPYSEYYYSSHGIVSERPIDMMFSTMVPDVMCFGTGYVFGDQSLIGYFDTPISIFLRDPVRLAARRDQRFTDDISGELIQSLFAIERVLRRALDIELIVDRRGQIFVAQIRSLSLAHSDNWTRVAEKTWHKVCVEGPPSNVVNTVGIVSGTVADFRRRAPSLRDFESGAQRICVVSHHGNESASTSALELLQFLDHNNLSNIVLVVDHGEARVDDHLQYITFEDRRMKFTVHATNIPEEIDGRHWRISSDGFRAVFE
jgi:hypothetical protein